MGMASGRYGGEDIILLEKPRGKRPLGISRRRCKNIKMNLNWDGTAWNAFTSFTIWTSGMLL
jgi:hypothetical protein